MESTGHFLRCLNALASPRVILTLGNLVGLRKLLSLDIWQLVTSSAT
ncbi:hypothetical protein C5167_000983 [Papaver somniferum]|uniref:Uncharacterized protein n=1 Tax=Papaver somniferum TaxID=3469 RepID=A0A4Y7KWX6_PAPSO|nr:hypothetical protein C5167_000983 [Papaver somniferum]